MKKANKNLKKFSFTVDVEFNKHYKNNCSNGGGGTLELPYRIRLFQCAKKRIGCRDPVLFSFLK